MGRRAREHEIDEADVTVGDPKDYAAGAPAVAVALKRAVAINGISGLCITKLDVLDGMKTLKICIAYQYHGKRTEYAPLDAQGWEECTPVYLEFPGWSESTAGITEWDKLPPAARAYLRALEELAGCPLAIVSTGPDRNANIVLRDPFA